MCWENTMRWNKKLNIPELRWDTLYKYVYIAMKSIKNSDWIFWLNQKHVENGLDYQKKGSNYSKISFRL